MSNFILAIDQSTSASKVMLFDRGARLVHRVSIAHKQYYPQPGFVEHDPMEIFEHVKKGMLKVMDESQIPVEAIAAIAITNQRETALIWDTRTGKPVCNAAVWQCRRGADFCRELREKGLTDTVKKKTGLVIDPYFSASKLKWMMDNLSRLNEKAASGFLKIGTIDSWLLWKLTGGAVHATDHSNACRTMLYDIINLKWDEELLETFHLHPAMMPEVKFSDEVFGYSSPEVIFNRAIPISGLIGDSHGALFGQCCFAPGTGKATYGTGSSVMVNIGKTPLNAPEGLVTSIGFACNNSIDYVFEGNIHCTGDTINWLKNELGLISDFSEAESLATSIDTNGGVYFVPAFVGLGAPYWDNEAKACITGLSRDSGKAQVVRAALESIAYQIKDLADMMTSGGSVRLQELRVDGGPTKNNFLMQFQADMLQSNVVCSEIEEISALGSTFMAGMAVGWWKDKNEISSLIHSGKTFAPGRSPFITDQLYTDWKSAVARSRLKTEI